MPQSPDFLVRNMVCQRCITTVQDILDALGIAWREVDLGEVYLDQDLNAAQRENLETALETQGFALLQDRESRLIQRIKTEVIRYVHHPPETNRPTLSAHLSVHLHREYSALSKLFSQVEGRTIEQYFLQQRIEKVKELLIYDELSLTQIADQLHFSNVAHLSGQFKKLTGMTPTAFRQMGAAGRQPLDKI